MKRFPPYPQTAAHPADIPHGLASARLPRTGDETLPPGSAGHSRFSIPVRGVDNRQGHGSNVPLLPGTVLPGISAGAWASLPCPVASSPHRQARSHSPTVRRLPFSPARTGQLQNQSHPHLHHIRSSGNACPASCWGSYRCGTGSKPSRFCLPGFRNAPQPVLS